MAKVQPVTPGAFDNLAQHEVEILLLALDCIDWDLVGNSELRIETADHLRFALVDRARVPESGSWFTEDNYFTE